MARHKSGGGNGFAGLSGEKKRKVVRHGVSEESTCLMVEIHHAAFLFPKVPLKKKWGGGGVSGPNVNNANVHLPLGERLRSAGPGSRCRAVAFGQLCSVCCSDDDCRPSVRTRGTHTHTHTQTYTCGSTLKLDICSVFAYGRAETFRGFSFPLFLLPSFYMHACMHACEHLCVHG